MTQKVFLSCALAVLLAFGGAAMAKQKAHPAYASFGSFAQNWAYRVNANYRCTPGNAEVVRRGTQFVARYFMLDHATIQTKVKPSGNNLSPFVGIMKYIEGTYESTGATEEAALQGPYSLVKRTRVTDIFRYTKGNWVY